MALINNATREITAKIVYYGPGLGGKTTNLKYIFDTLPMERKGKMISLQTETDRTLFFDFLPIELGRIKDFKTRVQLYTVPGQVFYDATRKLVLQGVDGVVFVADSQMEMLQSDEESLENLKVNLEEKRIALEELPLVLQFNKRDLPNILSVERLNERLNPLGCPSFEASALQGDGVNETFHAICRLVLEKLSGKFVSLDREAGAMPFKKYVPEPEEEEKPPAPTLPQGESGGIPLGTDEDLEPASARKVTEEALAHSLGASAEMAAFPLEPNSEQTFTSMPRPNFDEDFISLSDLEEIADIHEIVSSHEPPAEAAPVEEAPQSTPVQAEDAASPKEAEASPVTEVFDVLEGPLDLGFAPPGPPQTPADHAEVVVPVDLTALNLESRPDALEIKFTIKLLFKKE